MTREEFDEILEQTNAVICNREWYERAIEVLEQEPCEDCISRQATVERLCKVADFMNEKRSGLGSPYIMAALFIQDNKDEFPSVIPEPKTDVLDKIRAEITTLQNRCYSLTKGTMCAFCKFECKYTAESEDKE